MNKYLIIHKIKTLSSLNFFDIDWTKVNIDWYEIENWQYSIWKWATWNSWIVKKEVENINIDWAINKFRNDFKEISYKISLISQCYFDFLWEWFLILKQNNNEKRRLLLRFFNDIPPIWLTFTKDVYNSFIKLHNVDNLKWNQFFVYMNELNITVWYYAKLWILCSALESLSWKVEKQNNWKPYFTYDINKMKLILWWKLYDKVFWNNWLRHKIQHWDSIDKFYWDNYVDILYKKILEYLNLTYDLWINLNIVNPQRHFFWNREYTQVYLEPKSSEIEIDIRYFDKDNIKFNNDSDFILLNNSSIENY